jgi:hydrogenase expression/formation protein HypC
MCLGIPGKITELYEENGLKMGKVDFGGVVKNVCLEYIPECVLGDYTVVHVGFGISRLDEKEAQETLSYLREIGALDDELGGEDTEPPE